MRGGTSRDDSGRNAGSFVSFGCQSVALRSGSDLEIDGGPAGGAMFAPGGGLVTAAGAGLVSAPGGGLVKAPGGGLVTAPGGNTGKPPDCWMGAGCVKSGAGGGGGTKTALEAGSLLLQ